MKLDSLAFRIFLILVALSALQMAYYYPALPDRVASHFGAGGEPNGWSSKAGFITTFAVMLIGEVVIFLGIPVAVSRLPTTTISLPNKDYWLAPERKEATLSVLASYFLWFGNATLLFMMVVMQMTIRANLEPPHRLSDGFMVVFVAYMAFVAVATIWLLLRFRKPSR